MISEIATGTCAPPPNVLRDSSALPPSGAPLMPSPLSFSLLSAHEGSLADQIAPDQDRWADWTDGLNMLRRDGGHVASKETAGFVQALTEIGLKIKLLGMLPVRLSQISPCLFCVTDGNRLPTFRPFQTCPVRWLNCPAVWLLGHHLRQWTFSMPTFLIEDPRRFVSFC